MFGPKLPGAVDRIKPVLSKVTGEELTRILEVHVVPIQSILQPVAHDFELHDLLADIHVRFGDVELHFRVVDLIGQAVAHHLRKVPDQRRGMREVLSAGADPSSSTGCHY